MCTMFVDKCAQFGMSVLTTVSVASPTPQVLSTSLIFSVLYVWCRINKTTIVQFWFGVQVPVNIWLEYRATFWVAFHSCTLNIFVLSSISSSIWWPLFGREGRGGEGDNMEVVTRVMHNALSSLQAMYFPWVLFFFFSILGDKWVASSLNGASNDFTCTANVSHPPRPQLGQPLAWYRRGTLVFLFNHAIPPGVWGEKTHINTTVLVSLSSNWF